MSSLRPLRIVTRCTSVDEFVAYFGPLADDHSIFLGNPSPPGVGARHPFSIHLANGDLVMRGEGEVQESRPTAFRWRILSMDDIGKTLLGRLCALRDVGALPPPQENLEVTLQEETAVFQPAPIMLSGPPEDSGKTPAPPVLPARPDLPPQVPPGAFGKTPPPERIRPRDQFSTGEERAWYDDIAQPDGSAPKPPASPSIRAPITNRDEQYADEPSAPRRFWFAISGTAAAALAIGLLAGYLIWGGKKSEAQPPSQEVASNAPTKTNAPEARQAPPAADPPAATQDDNKPQPAPVAAGGDCKISIKTEPPGADVTIAGKPAGKSPVDSAVPCGDVQIGIDKARYAHVDRTVTAAAGTPATLDEKLARPDAMLDFVSTPAGATIIVDGKPAGTAPVSAKVNEFGTVTVSASMTGYKPWSQKVYVKTSKQRVTVTLEAAKATTVKKPPRHSGHM
jgi:hypothetical protein